MRDEQQTIEQQPLPPNPDPWGAWLRDNTAVAVAPVILMFAGLVVWVVKHRKRSLCRRQDDA